MSLAGYFQIRKPGVGSSPVGAVYTQIGVDGLLTGQPSVALVGTTVTPITVVCGPSSKVLDLWGGSANAAPPANWQDPAFNDSAWVHGARTADYPLLYIPGADMIWLVPAVGSSQADQLLYRQVFTLPSGAVSSAVLQIAVDTLDLGVWINGMWAFQNRDPLASHGYTPDTVALPPSLFLPGQSNLIAIWAGNDTDATGNVCFKLTIS